MVRHGGICNDCVLCSNLMAGRMGGLRIRDQVDPHEKQGENRGHDLEYRVL